MCPPVSLTLLAISISIGFLLTVLFLIRAKVLKEQYSLVWIAASFVMVFFSFSRSSLEAVAARLGIHYAPSLLFLTGLVFAFLLNLHLTAVVSRMSAQTTKLTQEMALLAREIEHSTRSHK